MSEDTAIHTQRPDGREDLCCFYNTKKNRFCNLQRKRNTLFCGEHAPEEVSKRKRIPCPLDPSHMIFADKVKQHIYTQCPSRRNEQLEYAAWFSKDANVGPVLDNLADQHLEYDSLPKWLNSVSKEEIDAFFQRIEQVYAVAMHLIGEDEVSGPSEEYLSFDLQLRNEEKQAAKHAPQHESLLAHLDKHSLLDGDSCRFIEWGAGKGLLSQSIHIALKNRRENGVGSQSPKFLLIDRSNCRYKPDTRMGHEGSVVTRIRADIKDLRIEQHPFIQEALADAMTCCQNKTVNVSKHLCGIATDLSLRCLQRSVASVEGDKIGAISSGIFICLCCHDKCDFRTYVGRDFWQQEFGLDRKDFELMCMLSPWACFYAAIKDATDTDGLLRLRIAWKAKRIIDAGRVLFLQRRCG